MGHVHALLTTPGTYRPILRMRRGGSHSRSCFRLLFDLHEVSEKKALPKICKSPPYMEREPQLRGPSAIGPAGGEVEPQSSS